MIGQMPKSSDQSAGARTRERILDAAVELVAEEGWQQVTSREVAARAGVNQGLVHYHFGSMEALLREAVIGRLEREMAEPIERMLASDSPAAGLRQVSDWLRTLEPTGAMAMLSAEVLAYATRDEAVREWMVRLLREIRAQMRDSIAAAQAAGELRSDVDAYDAAVLAAALIDGLIFHGLIDPDLPLDAVANTLDALLAEPTLKEA